MQVLCWGFLKFFNFLSGNSKIQCFFLNCWVFDFLIFSNSWFFKQHRKMKSRCLIFWVFGFGDFSNSWIPRFFFCYRKYYVSFLFLFWGFGFLEIVICPLSKFKRTSVVFLVFDCCFFRFPFSLFNKFSTLKFKKCKCGFMNS